jgi:hypothetical protein
MMRCLKLEGKTNGNAGLLALESWLMFEETDEQGCEQQALAVVHTAAVYPESRAKHTN